MEEKTRTCNRTVPSNAYYSRSTFWKQVCRWQPENTTYTLRSHISARDGELAVETGETWMIGVRMLFRYWIGLRYDFSKYVEEPGLDSSHCPRRMQQERIKFTSWLCSLTWLCGAVLIRVIHPSSVEKRIRSETHPQKTCFVCLLNVCGFQVRLLSGYQRLLVFRFFIRLLLEIRHIQLFQAGEICWKLAVIVHCLWSLALNTYHRTLMVQLLFSMPTLWFWPSNSDSNAPFRCFNARTSSSSMCSWIFLAQFSNGVCFLLLIT